MTERTGGDVVVETLTALGARHVFGIPGQHALGLFDALRRSPLTFVSSRVENNSAFGADGYSRVTGEVGVLFLSTGPGALTSLGALQEAYATGVPLVVVASQVPRRGLGGTRNGLLHQLDDQQASARNVTKSTALVRDAAQLPAAIADAWALAEAAPSGPTWVEVPEDVLLGPAGVPPVLSAPAAIAPSREPRAELVAEAAGWLSSARRPVILAGGGVRRSPGAPEALRRLAETLDAPVVATVGGKGAIDFAHPLSAASWIEDRQTTELLEQADVLLAVGTAIGEVTSNYFTFAPRGRLIQVDADPRVLGSNYPSLGIPADAALALERHRGRAQRPRPGAHGRAAGRARCCRTSLRRRGSPRRPGQEPRAEAVGRSANRCAVRHPHLLGHDDRGLLGLVGVGPAGRWIPLRAGLRRARIRLSGRGRRCRRHRQAHARRQRRRRRPLLDRRAGCRASARCRRHLADRR